jgi:hypothetical protein
LAARWLGALALAHAAMSTAMACGMSYTIDARELTRTVDKRGTTRSVTWTLNATHSFGQVERTRMIGGAPQASWVRFSRDGTWSARIGLENDLRIRPVEMKVAFGFSIAKDMGSRLIPAAYSGEIIVPERGARWIDVSGKRGPEGVAYDLMLQGKVAPRWTVSCAVHG